jgi:hypothetical protein
MNLISVLPGNNPVNMVQHATINEAVFSVLSALSSGGTTGLCKPAPRQWLGKHISAYWTVL